MFFSVHLSLSVAEASESAHRLFWNAISKHVQLLFHIFCCINITLFFLLYQCCTDGYAFLLGLWSEMIEAIGFLSVCNRIVKINLLSSYCFCSFWIKVKGGIGIGCRDASIVTIFSRIISLVLFFHNLLLHVKCQIHAHLFIWSVSLALLCFMVLLRLCFLIFALFFQFFFLILFCDILFVHGITFDNLIWFEYLLSIMIIRRFCRVRAFETLV